jgi:hypothetical protein
MSFFSFDGIVRQPEKGKHFSKLALTFESMAPGGQHLFVEGAPPNTASQSARNALVENNNGQRHTLQLLMCPVTIVSYYLKLVGG